MGRQQKMPASQIPLAEYWGVLDMGTDLLNVSYTKYPYYHVCHIIVHPYNLNINQQTNE